jgi:uncharacterized OB-fold protein
MGQNYRTTVFCAGCRASMQVEARQRGQLTAFGLTELKRAGWRFVATEGLQCRACRDREEVEQQMRDTVDEWGEEATRCQQCGTPIYPTKTLCAACEYPDIEE